MYKGFYIRNNVRAMIEGNGNDCTITIIKGVDSYILTGTKKDVLVRAEELIGKIS